MEALFCPISLACGLLNEVTLAWTPPLSPLAPFPQYINTFGTLEYLFNVYLFFWLHQVLVATHGNFNFHCGMWDLVP